MLDGMVADIVCLGTVSVSLDLLYPIKIFAT
jgi:hypothetical protein